MKSAAVLFCVLALALAGCPSVPRTIEATTSRLSVQESKNKHFEISFAKEMAAEGFSAKMDPKTGAIEITATKIQTSSTKAIDAAGEAAAKVTAAQAEAMSKLSDTINRLLSTFLAGAIPAVIPAPADPAPAP